MKALLATDGSEQSENAARFLARIAWSASDAITVFHAIYELPFRSDEEFHRKTLMAIKKEIAPKIIDSIANILKTVQAGISGEIKESPPGRCTPEQCIMDAAEASGADLIVMGSRGIKGAASVFLGSVTRLVTIRASVPVLVVKAQQRGGSGAMKILFATDGSNGSLVTEKMLIAMPFTPDTEITIVHVASSGFADIPARYTAELDEQTKRTATDAIGKERKASETVAAAAGERLRKKYRNLTVLTLTGDPSEKILALAREGCFDLIVAGSRGQRGLQGLLGSNSRNILTHADCSVLIGNSP